MDYALFHFALIYIPASMLVAGYDFFLGKTSPGIRNNKIKVPTDNKNVYFLITTEHKRPSPLCSVINSSSKGKKTACRAFSSFFRPLALVDHQTHFLSRS